MSKRLRYTLYVAGLTGLWWVMGGRAWYADRLIDAECTDTKNFAIYESVKRPKDADGKSAKIDIKQISEDEFSIENGEYIMRRVRETLVNGNSDADGLFPPLRIWKVTYFVRRSSDNKLLGFNTMLLRAGGSFNYGHTSSHNCTAGYPSIISAILRGDR